MEFVAALAGAIFAAAFFLLALGRIGRQPVPRGLVALVAGAATALLLRLDPYVVNAQVLLLLAGLMVLAGLAQGSGLFAGLRHRLVRLPPPLALWLSLLVVAATSAAILNDAAVVVLVPFLLPAYRLLGLPLVPCVVLAAMAANIGSLLTPFGNPQNAVLADAAHLSAADFLRVQGPIVALGILLLAALASWTGRRATPPQPALDFPAAIPRGRAWVALCILAFVAAAATTTWHGVALGTLAAAAAALAYAGIRPRIGRDADRVAWVALDWNVIALFVGLYFLTAGLPAWFPSDQLPLAALGTATYAGAATTLLSNAVGNVPAILTFLRLDAAWTVAHAQFLVTTSTLGGTVLLTGSAASLLAADVARRNGVTVGFVDYLRLAAWSLPILVAGAWWTW